MSPRQYLLIVLLACTAARSSVADEPTWPREHRLTSGITYKLRGRIDTDAIWTEQSAKNEADFGALGDVVGLRRRGSASKATSPNDGLYVAEIDLASGNVVIRDLSPAARSASSAQTVSAISASPSASKAVQADYFAFMERSPVNVLDPARNWGLGLYHVKPTDDSALSLGFFYGGTDQNDFEGGNRQHHRRHRPIHFAPINEGDGEQLLHFGVALAERLPTRAA